MPHIPNATEIRNSPVVMFRGLQKNVIFIMCLQVFKRKNSPVILFRGLQGFSRVRVYTRAHARSEEAFLTKNIYSSLEDIILGNSYSSN